jgi:hypothetical protein
LYLSLSYLLNSCDKKQIPDFKLEVGDSFYLTDSEILLLLLAIGVEFGIIGADGEGGAVLNGQGVERWWARGDQKALKLYLITYKFRELQIFILNCI